MAGCARPHLFCQEYLYGKARAGKGLGGGILAASQLCKKMKTRVDAWSNMYFRLGRPVECIF